MDELGSMSVRGLEEAKKSASLARHALAAEQPALMEAEGHVHKSRYILGCLGLEVELQHLAPLVNKLRLLEHARRRAALACPRSLKYDDISLTHDPALPHTRDQAQTIEVTPTINGLDPHDQHLAPARPFVFRISPALPEGMRMDVATGEIAGWPTHCSRSGCATRSVTRSPSLPSASTRIALVAPTSRSIARMMLGSSWQ